MITNNCRSCGYEMESGAPTCGNCGQPARSGIDPNRPLASGGPLGSPGGPLAGGRGPLAALVKPLVALLVVVGLGTALFGPAQNLIRTVTGIVDEFEGVGEPGGGAANKGAGDPEQPASGYATVEEIVAELRAGGVKCRNVTLDTSVDTLESGSCNVRGTHVQILVYRTRGTLEFAATEIYGDDWPFTYVHDQNWFISTTTPLARKIHDVLGGELVVPPGG